MSTLNLVRTVSFSAAHRYFNPKLSLEENQRTYGSLMNAEGYGHNFLVEAHVSGDVDPLTGMIINLVDLDAWLKSVAIRFDHQDLNVRPEFLGEVPTPERIALYFATAMQNMAQAKKTRIRKIRVYEGESLWVDFFP